MAELDAIVDAFLSASGSAEAAPDRADLGEVLAEAVARGRVRWPDVELGDTAFAKYLGSRLAAKDVANAPAEDLFLACASGAGNAKAIAHCRDELLPQLGRALSRMGVEPELREELLATLGERLFFGRPDDAAPLIAGYSGRGKLAAWLQSVGIHEALKVRRREHREAPIDELATRLASRSPDPEAVYLKTFYGAQFREALSRAMKALSARDRNLLRQHYLDGVSLDALGKAYRVHRATVARRLSEARSLVLSRAREELGHALELRDSELDSVVTFVRQQSSFGAYLAEVAGALAKPPAKKRT